MSRRTIQPVESPLSPGYPNRSEGAVDTSRRRFLRQIIWGSGAVGMTGLRAAHAQAPDVDFSVLEAHAHPDTAVAVDPPEEPMRRRRSGRSDQEPDTTPREAQPTEADVTLVTENRALWVDPAYLVLLQWTRPVEAEGPITALEASAEAVGELLAERLTDTAMLHDVDRLYALETAVAELLSSRVAPAHIDVLHLDHDCQVVCGPTVEPDPPVVRGRIAAPRP